MKKMITGNVFGGGLCNRMLLYAHCMAVCMENGYDFFIVNDEAMEQALVMDKANSCVHLKNINSLLWRVRVKLCKIMKVLSKGQEQSKDTIMERIGQGKNVFVRTYYFRDYPLLIKYQKIIRNSFVFREIYTDRAEQIIANIRAIYEPEVVVAVHMRKGDYKTWRAGKFYYKDEEYLERMKSLAQKGQRVHFLLISNEEVCLSYFKDNLEEMASVSTVSGNQFEDLMTLAYSDYIMGPQSTFSAMAAFLGNKPLLFFDREIKRIDFPEFSWEKVFHDIFNGIKLK